MVIKHCLYFCIRYLHKGMRATQRLAAKMVVTYSTMIWRSFCQWESAGVPSADTPAATPNQRAQLRTLLGELPMASADHWVFPLYGR
jgi:hypothetical protein